MTTLQDHEDHIDDDEGPRRQVGPTTDHVDKGKRRADEPSERTPLISRRDDDNSTAGYVGYSLSSDPERQRLGRATSSSPPPSPTNPNRPSTSLPHHRLRSRLATVFLYSLTATILIFSLLAILAWSYASKAAGMDPNEVIERHLVVVGPEKVDILRIGRRHHDGPTLVGPGEGGGEGGKEDECGGSLEVHVRVTGRVGMDVGSAMGINGGANDGVLDGVWKWVGRKGVQGLVERVTVNMSTISVRMVSSRRLNGNRNGDGEEEGEGPELVRVLAPAFELPLTVDPPTNKDDTKWLTRMTLPVIIQPCANVSVLVDYLKESWKVGSFALQANVADAIIRGGGLDRTGWRSKFWSRLRNVNTAINVRFPSLPGLPHPGNNLPFPSFSQLITLTSFNVSSTVHSILVHASALAINPAPPSLTQSTIPSLPFVVSLPNTINASSDDQQTTGNRPPIAVVQVTTSPFPLTTHPNVSLTMDGHVLPLSLDSPDTRTVLSNFITRYLSSKPNDILISSPLLSPSPPNPNDPSPYPISYFKATFPSPSPPPEILRNLTIENMKIRPSGSRFLASGTVKANVVLPKGVRVGLEVVSVLPDVLVFDGEVEDWDWDSGDGDGREEEDVWPRRRKGGAGDGGGKSGKHHKDPGKDQDKDKDDEEDPPLPPELPLPDPLPEHAFGHIRPEDWLDAISEPISSPSSSSSSYAIEASVTDVPIRVLPGRQKEFSNFVGKVIFSGSDGAVAGIWGSAAVVGVVEGLGGSAGGRVQNSMDGQTLRRKKRQGQVVLEGLPVKGSVVIGKKGF